VRIRVDLHAHTRHSLDASTSPARLVERAREAGLDRIAVTDHGVISGALEARELDPSLVIVGEEIRCADGSELIGLFLSERIPDRLTIEATAERIRGQGGVVYAPHPYAYPWRTRSRAQRVLEVADVAEVFNSRAFLPPWNYAARRGVARRRIPQGAGSDAHFPFEIGRAYVEMPAFDGPAEFLEAVVDARAVGRKVSGAHCFLASSVLRAARSAAETRRLLLQPIPEPPVPLR